jgi:hypothetical protein
LRADRILIGGCRASGHAGHFATRVAFRRADIPSVGPQREAFRALPQDRLYSWLFLLSIVATAIAAGQTTVVEMALWAQRRADELVAALKAKRPRIPGVATLQRILRHIDLPALAQQGATHHTARDAAVAGSSSLRSLGGPVLRGQALCPFARISRRGAGVDLHRAPPCGIVSTVV